MLHIVLTDDWELRGNGSGNPRALQFGTARALMDLYERFGLRCSFNADVMQQLAFRQAGANHEELRLIADEWDACVREMLRRGHDVELHTHPQWDGAVFESGRFHLNPEWSLQRCPEEKVRRILTGARDYLAELGQRENPAYHCVAYRAGAWALAPSASILPALAELGIVLDMSIVSGMFHDTASVSFDYRTVDEGYRPYYPDMADARRMSTKPEPIICVPTATAALLDDEETASLRKALGSILGDPTHPEYAVYALPPDHVRVEGADQPLTTATPHPLPSPERAPAPIVPSPSVPQALRGIAPGMRVFDLSSLSFIQMCQMLGVARRRAAAQFEPLPVIVENHTKYLGDFRPVEKFCGLLASAEDIKVITSRELAENLHRGVYSIRTRSSLGVAPARLRSAIAGRLEEVRARMAGLTAAASAPEPSPADHEETLRRFMVRTFASIAGGRTTDRTPDAFFEQLARLVEPARSDDWRYLDAWNNGFEALETLNAGQTFAPRVRWLLETYAELLESRIATLTAAGADRESSA